MFAVWTTLLAERLEVVSQRSYAPRPAASGPKGGRGGGH
jgi:hypothetical protein